MIVGNKSKGVGCGYDRKLSRGRSLLVGRFILFGLALALLLILIFNNSTIDGVEEGRAYGIIRNKTSSSILDASHSIESLVVRLTEVERQKKALEEENSQLKSKMHPMNSSQPSGGSPPLDFFIMGFPKCGTTSLMVLFDNWKSLKIVSPEDSIRPLEFPIAKRDQTKTLIDKIADSSRKFPTVKFGIKWPTAVRNVHAVRVLTDLDARHSATKLIIGLRHPITWFESFYNFRTRTLSLPNASSLIGGREVEVGQIYTAFAQYERYLMQLGKVDLNANELMFLSGPEEIDTEVLSIPNKIFVYSLEQFMDKNISRLDIFLNDLKIFMGFDEELSHDMLPKSNIHSTIEIPGLINICDNAHNDVRRELLQNAQGTVDWILERLSKAREVTIGNRENFFDIVKTWKTDPCNKTSTKRNL